MSNQQELFVPKSKHRAIRMPVLLLSALAFALIGIGALFGVWKLTLSPAAAAKRDILREDYRAQKAQNDALIAEANDKRNELIHLVRETTNYLTVAYLTLTKIETEVQDTKTNEDGLLIAKHPDLVNQANAVFSSADEASPAIILLADKLETARRLDIDLQEANGSTLFPESALCDAIKQSRDWALAKLKKITELDIAATAIVRDARTRVSFVPDRQPDSEVSQQSIPPSFVPDRRQFSAVFQQSILSRPISYGVPRFKTAPPQPSPVYVETQPSKSYVWITQIIADNRLTLREKALNTRVQIALDPFLAVGTYYPGRQSFGYSPLRFERPRPMSYKRMKNLGALETDDDGLLEFVELATDLHDDRPRLRKPFSKINWEDDPELRTEAQMLQSLFLLLGPTYVSLGMLDP